MFASNPGVLLVGHGTRDEVGTSQFFELGKLLAERLHPTPVATCLLEFQEPTIPQAWESLVARAVDHVFVAPLLLFAAGHAKQDIPELVARCQSKTAGVTFEQTRPISRHRSIIELAVRRLGESLHRIDTAAARTAVVMVGRGSRDPCATADMRVLSAVVDRRVEVAQVATAFYAMASPAVPTVIDMMAQSGRFDAIVVQPHLLFDGRLYQAIAEQAAEAALRFPSIRFSTSNYLGPDPLVAEAIAGRILDSSNSIVDLT